jgi:uncharacterized OB-fold protein
MAGDKTTNNNKKRIPIREGLLTSPLSPLKGVRIIGSKCTACEEVTLGEAASCPNCAGVELETIPFSKKGFLWTYTVIRNRPPGDYKGPDPFVPFGEGLVELPEGIRVLSPIAVDVDKLEIGMELDFDAHVLYEDNDGNEVVAFRFIPATEG